MATLLDTNVLIEAERRGLDFSDLPVERTEELSVSALTMSEMLFGQYSAQTAQQRTRRETFFRNVIENATVLGFDLQVAEVHARIWRHLRTVGGMIGLHDLIIASTALTHGHAVMTGNFEEFSRVPGLQVFRPNW